jgi:hypothetical protein
MAVYFQMKNWSGWAFGALEVTRIPTYTIEARTLALHRTYYDSSERVEETRQRRNRPLKPKLLLVPADPRKTRFPDSGIGSPSSRNRPIYNFVIERQD